MERFKHDHGAKEASVDFLFRVKKQHPQKIVLIQIGEFYETWGIDSVFLVEHCGINRMGRKGPRAGMSLANPKVKLQNIKLIKMLCEGDIPTYKAVDGVDLNSSAFYTALKIGVDLSIVERAQEIAQGFDVLGSPSFFAENSAADFLHNMPRTDLAKEILAATAGADLAQVKHLKENEMPSLSDIGCSIVCVLKTANNFFYAGETDNFLHRVMAHKNRLADDKCEFFYVTIKEGKSAARQIEQQLITKLKNSGLPMISVSDAKNLSFGVLQN